MLTNYKTISQRIKRIYDIEAMEEDGTFDKLSKKEVLKLRLEYDKLNKNLGGIKEMKGMPGAIFVVDPKKEKIAVSEAKTLGIPVVGIVDTNCDPDDVDYIIPANDDAIRAVKLISSCMADAIIEAKQGESFDESEPAAEAEEAVEEAAEAAEAAGEAPAYNAAGEEAGIIDDEEAYSDTAKQADKSEAVAGDKAADKAADGATASTAGVLGLEKATYDEGALTIEMRETLPADADEMVYTIKTKDAKGRETICAEGILKDMITKKDPLTLDIGDLDLSDGTYILTIGTDSIEFTVQ
jgi:hypothetical protein